jgi:hypothetical protein
MLPWHKLVHPCGKVNVYPLAWCVDAQIWMCECNQWYAKIGIWAYGIWPAHHNVKGINIGIHTCEYANVLAKQARCDTCATHAWHECHTEAPLPGTKGVRGWFLIHEMHLKIFSIKFPDPQGAPTFCVSLTTDYLYKWENPYGVNHRGCFRLWLVRYRTLRMSYCGWLPKGYPYVGCSWNLHQST